jgi:hypothetical protein
METSKREDIVPYGSLDEETACRHFLGKTIDEAVAMFNEASLIYQEDLMWMGLSAFNYYVKAAVKYIESDASNCDSGMAHCFVGLLEFRLEWEGELLSDAAEDLLKGCNYIIDHYNKFDLDADIYGDLRPRLFKIIEQLEALRRE